MDKRRVGYLLFFISFVLLMALGSWQVLRGLEKGRILDATSMGAQDIVMLDKGADDWHQLRYRWVELDGEWMSAKSFLMVNRIYRNRAGAEVLTPFRLLDGTVLLVNRGWVSEEEVDEKLSVVLRNEIVRGQLYLPQKGFTLGETYTPPVVWPLAVLYYDFDALSDVLGEGVSPAVVVLDVGNVDGFIRIWQPGVIKPARHYGYAVQWFGLALTLLIFGFIWRRRVLT